MQIRMGVGGGRGGRNNEHTTETCIEIDTQYILVNVFFRGFVLPT